MSRLSARSLRFPVLFGAQLAVGSAALMARAGLAAGLSATAMSAWRLTIASLILLIALNLAAARRDRRPPRIDGCTLARLMVAGICLGLHFVAWFASLQHVSVARSTLLVATGPLWAGLGGRFLLGHRLKAAFWMGLAVAAVGVWLVTQGADAGSLPPQGDGSALLGDLQAVAGAVFVAAYLLLVEDLQSRLGTWRVVAWTYSTAAASLLPVVVLWEGIPALLPASSAAWATIFGLALIPQLLGHTAINWSLRHFPAGLVAASTLLEPIFAAGLAWAVLGERISWLQGAGAVVLLGGVLLALRGGAASEPETVQTPSSAADNA
jgi:drug/metabolite transporter (DMT)-like permease